jgi:hypothetical protein
VRSRGPFFRGRGPGGKAGQRGAVVGLDELMFAGYRRWGIGCAALQSKWGGERTGRRWRSIFIRWRCGRVAVTVHGMAARNLVAAATSSVSRRWTTGRWAQLTGRMTSWARIAGWAGMRRNSRRKKNGGEREWVGWAGNGLKRHVGPVCHGEKIRKIEWAGWAVTKFWAGLSDTKIWAAERNFELI